MNKWDLPKGWEWVSLGSPKHFVRRGGGTPSKSISEFWDDGTLPWLSSTELDEKQVNIIKNTKLRITKKGIDNSSAEIVPKNSILLTCTASIGKVAINHIDLATNQQFNSFECKKGVLPKYVAYYLLTQKNNLIKLGGTTSFCHITIPSLSKIEIPLPPLETQQKIVAILDKAEEIKRLHAEANTQTQELIQSVFLDMFGDPVKNQKGWPTISFNELCKNIRYGTSSPPVFSETGISFIRATNIKNGIVVNNNMKYISSSEGNKIKKCKIKENNLIVVRSGVNTGDCARISSRYSGCYAAYDLIVELKNDFDAPFINFLLNYTGIHNKIKMISRRAGQPHLNADQLSNVSVINPPLNLRQFFGKLIIQNEYTGELSAKQQINIDELATKLTHFIFKGELIT